MLADVQAVTMVGWACAVTVRVGGLKALSQVCLLSRLCDQWEMASKRDNGVISGVKNSRNGGFHDEVCAGSDDGALGMCCDSETQRAESTSAGVHADMMSNQWDMTSKSCSGVPPAVKNRGNEGMLHVGACVHGQ